MYTVNIEQFEGPLDLLLEIIEQKKLPLLDIRLSIIAEDFISHIKTLDNRQPDELITFLSIASRLALLKSRELVPDNQDLDEEEGSIEELEQRLALYQPFRKGAKALRSLDRKHNILWQRDSFANHEAIEYIPESLSKQDLSRIIKETLDNITLSRRIPQAKVKITISIEECIQQLEKMLAEAKKVNFSQFVYKKGKEEQVAHFMGMLELVRKTDMRATQEGLFGTITLHNSNERT